jgi:hypothetical protein
MKKIKLFLLTISISGGLINHSFAQQQVSYEEVTNGLPLLKASLKPT